MAPFIQGLRKRVARRSPDAAITEARDFLSRRTRDKRATLDDVFHCFRLILGREPSAEDLAMHRWRVGQKLEDVVTTYVQSPEFEQRNLLKCELGENVRLAKLDGFSIYYQDSDVDVGRIVARGYYEREIQRVFRRVLRPGMTAVDIGANIGFFTMLAASLVGADGRVVAVEPNPTNVKLIEASRRLNAFDRVELHAVAASDKPGVLALNTSNSNGFVRAVGDDLNALWRSNVVYGVPLDRALSLDRLDFIKIDVEGAEHVALRGFRETVARHRPIIVSEFSPIALGDEGRGYLSFLMELGYRLGVVQPSGDVDDKGSDADAIVQAWRDRGSDHIDLLVTTAP